MRLDAKNETTNTSKLQHMPEEGRMRLRDELERYNMIEKEVILSCFTFPTEPSKDGYYHMMVPDHRVKSGRKHYKARTIEELKNKVYLHQKGISGYASKSFYDVFAITQDEQLKYVKSESKRASVINTVSRHWQDYNRYFKGTDFENKRIEDITKKDIEDIILTNLTRYSLRKRAFENMTALIRVVFRLAYKQEWILRDTFDLIDLKDSRFINMIVDPVNIEERMYSEFEMHQIRNEILHKHEDAPDYMPAYALEMQILLGLRRAEVCALKFSDIVIDGKSNVTCLMIRRELLSVKKSEINPKEHSQIVEHTKTNKNRMIPIFDELRDLINTIARVHKEYGFESEFLFPADNNIGCISVNTVYNYYRRICNRKGISIQSDVIRGPHAFRRNAAERIINSGGDAETVSRLLGNTQSVLKKNYYDGLDLLRAQSILNTPRSITTRDLDSTSLRA